MVLKASYEATLLVAVEQARKHKGDKGAGIVYLTQLGGGVFQNADEWINDAIDYACARCQHHDIDVRIVNYSGRPSAHQAELIAKYGETPTHE
jgi:hypothetical protein